VRFSLVILGPICGNADYRYDLEPAPQTVEQKKASLASHDNPSGGKLILGHTSFLTAFLLSFDEKFIITADRDEHIRVSWYPQGYTIEIYCLGHEKCVMLLLYASVEQGPILFTDSSPLFTCPSSPQQNSCLEVAIRCSRSGIG
jgi:tRNA (guanine-N(7)-)-methyltransferase subunit TRM82